MNEEILKLAEAADEYADTKLGKGEYHPDWHDVRDSYFYKAAYNKAIEDAAEVCDAKKEISKKWGKEGDWGEYADGFEDGIKECAAAIRARSE